MGVKFSKLCLPRCYSSSRGMLSRDVMSLPEDIQVDIFLKLPVNSILSCRCVCKAWCALLSNPWFVKTHLSNTTKRNNNSKLLFTGYENEKQVLCSIDYASMSSAASALPASSTTCTCQGTLLRKYPWQDATDEFGPNFMILGSCDGLIFICTSIERSAINNLCIWNPSTGEYRIERLHLKEIFDNFGFFYDSIVDFYKLARISPNRNTGCYQVEVHTIGSESCETFQSNYTFGALKLLSHSVLNGAFYCLGFKTINKVSSKVIVSFDMSRKKFVDLIFPEEANHLTSNVSRIEVMNNCLHIVTYSPSVNSIDVWKMQDYGVGESWIKVFTLTTNLITDIKYLKLQWSFASGEVLIENGKNKFLYDPKNDRTRSFKVHGIDGSNIQSTTYVESLVSVNSGTCMQGERRFS